MSEIEVGKLVGKKPYYCEQCTSNERYIDIHEDHILKRIIPTIKMCEGIDLFFLDGNLYKIDACYERVRIDDALSEFNSRYGDPVGAYTRNSLISFYQWEDGNTVLQLDYGVDDQVAIFIHLFDKASQKRISSSQGR
jgi:hypothetical protein